MMSPKIRKNTTLAIRIILGLLFLLSGIGKLIDGSDARYLVELLATKFYWLIEYAGPIVITTSLLELLFAALLLLGKKLKLAFWGSLALVTVFTLTLGYFYMQGMSIENCGCFGALGIGGGLTSTLIRNGVLLLLIIVGLIFRKYAEGGTTIQETATG